MPGRVVLAGAVIAAVLAAVAAWIMAPPEAARVEFPDGKRFAFTIVDDTDLATVESLRPVYELLRELGLRTTKTVWMLPGTERELWANRGQSMADPAYRDFILELRDRGFEIALHGARGGTSTRADIRRALDAFRAEFGGPPRIHVNHFKNRDNLYWGDDRLTFGPYRWLYGWMPGRDIFEGEEPDSPFFWGDLASEQVTYVVNFSFREINLRDVDPWFPYHDPAKPYVRYWFHTADGGRLQSFNALLRPENLDRLEREGGVCIVYTHFGGGFADGGELDPAFVARMRDVASRPGWFVPAGELLDHLRREREADPRLDWRRKLRLETLWLLDKLVVGSS